MLTLKVKYYTSSKSSVQQLEFDFKIGDTTLNYTSQSKYSGISLTQHLNYAVTEKALAQTANRALGILIAKSKAFGGLPYDSFTKLYNASVVPIITYASSVLSV